MVNWHGAQFIGGRTSVAGDSLIVRQRRPLVLMFADIAGSTQLSAVLEVEDYVELLTKVRGCLAEAVATHAGTVVRIDGDGALCVFGYPDSFEDAGRRAIECAIDCSFPVNERTRCVNRRATKLPAPGVSSMNRSNWLALTTIKSLSSNAVTLAERGRPSMADISPNIRPAGKFRNIVSWP